MAVTRNPFCCNEFIHVCVSMYMYVLKTNFIIYLRSTINTINVKIVHFRSTSCILQLLFRFWQQDGGVVGLGNRDNTE